ncbi:MAG TPA: phosphoglycerate kinase [Patescibacteria group bacterium]|jgi:phosphoglycerate kinase|nr:phosphoglycerate kinase [Patescibacteria group bacterium]
MIKPITSVKVRGRRVLLRVGYDVPLVEDKDTGKFKIADDTRIKDSLPTIEYLVKGGAKIILVSHLDRPKSWEMGKSLWPVAEQLAVLLNRKIVKVEDRLPDYNIPQIYFLSSDIEAHDKLELTHSLKNGDILFLENLRFYSEEEANEDKFVTLLASFADLYVNDAFSVSHRPEASIYGVAMKLKSYAGLALIQEIRSLERILKNPQKPLVIMMGGAKITDKVATINNLAKHASHVLIGGAIGNSFLKAKGYEIGKSSFADLSVVKEVARNFREKIILPVDVVVVKSLEDDPRAVRVEKVLPDDLIVDVGPETIGIFSQYIKTAKTLVWNGPFGLIEYPKFAFGSKSLSRIFAARCKGEAYGVAGGGETIEVLDQAKVSEFVDHISMGGGAMLDFLAGKKLPGIKVLESSP